MRLNTKRDNQGLPKGGEAVLKVFIIIKKIFMFPGKSCIQRMILPLVLTLSLPKNIPNFLSNSPLKKIEFVPFMGKLGFSG